MRGRGIFSKIQSYALFDFCYEPGKTFASFDLGKFQGSNAPSRETFVKRDPGMSFAQTLENFLLLKTWHFPQLNHKLACQIFECSFCPGILRALEPPGGAPFHFFPVRFHSVRFSGHLKTYLSA